MPEIHLHEPDDYQSADGRPDSDDLGARRTLRAEAISTSVHYHLYLIVHTLLPIKVFLQEHFFHRARLRLRQAWD